MPRGIVPRQPAKTGRHEGARVARTVKVPQKTVVASPRPGPFDGAQGRRASTPVPTPSKYNALAPERIAEILKRLDQLYPDVTCALTHRTAWELLVATILSAQSTDANVNRVTPELFRKYPTVQDFAALTPEQLEPDVRSTGFFRNKSKSVVGAARKIVGDFGGEVPAEMDKLLTLPGVARKTANVVLGTWFGKADGVVVDTHVHPYFAAAGADQELGRTQDRARLDASDPARKVDSVRPPDHLAWTQAVHRAPAEVRRVPVGEPVPRR